MKDMKMRKSDASRIHVGDIVRYKNSDFPLGVVTDGLREKYNIEK